MRKYMLFLSFMALSACGELFGYTYEQKTPVSYNDPLFVIQDSDWAGSAEAVEFARNWAEGQFYVAQCMRANRHRMPVHRARSLCNVTYGYDYTIARR